MRLESMSIPPDQFAPLVEELCFRFHKWDAYVGGKLRVLPCALTLTQEEHEDAVACSVAVHGALERAAARALDSPGLLDWLRIPPAVQQIIRAEIRRPEGIVRYDLIPTASGWQMPEVNEDAPGGFNESIASHTLFSRYLNGAGLAGNFAERFQQSLPPGRRAGLVYATGYAEDLQHLLILADLLRERGVEPVLASPEHLTCRPLGKPRLCGQSVDWIFRFFPGEWYPYLDNLAVWRRTAARIPILNPLARLVRQSKALFALWREMPLLDAADTALLNRHTPHTEIFKRERSQVYEEERDRWVVKKIFGRMGDTVALGRLCKPDAWKKVLEEACKEPDAYIAQHAFTPLPVMNGAGSLFPALGVYLINGAFAGYYSRADEVGLTTHEAYYVVTAVETA